MIYLECDSSLKEFFIVREKAYLIRSDYSLLRGSTLSELLSVYPSSSLGEYDSTIGLHPLVPLPLFGSKKNYKALSEAPK